MAANQPTITGVWGLGQHGEAAHSQINDAIKRVLFFSPLFWATGSAGKGQSRSIPVQPRLWDRRKRRVAATGSCPPRVFCPFSWECGGCACCSEGRTLKPSLVISPPNQSRIFLPCPFVRPFSITELTIFPLVSTHVPFVPRAWEDPCSQLCVQHPRNSSTCFNFCAHLNVTTSLPTGSVRQSPSSESPGK